MTSLEMKEWNYIRDDSYPKNEEEVIVVVRDDNGTLVICMAFHEELNGKHYFEIFTNSSFIHSGIESHCSPVICWKKKPSLPEELEG